MIGLEDQYMRFAMTFDTGAERYRWLNESLFLAEGHILGTSELEYRIYRVTLTAGTQTALVSGPQSPCAWSQRRQVSATSSQPESTTSE